MGLHYRETAVIKTVIALGAAVLRAACASKPAETTAAAPAQAGEESLKGPLETGTRVSRKGNDRMVKTIGNSGYRDDDAKDIKSIGNSVGGRSN